MPIFLQIIYIINELKQSNVVGFQMNPGTGVIKN